MRETLNQHGDKFVRNEFGRCEATARRAKHREVFRNATSVAAMREQYSRAADKAKSPPVRVGLLLE